MTVQGRKVRRPEDPPGGPTVENLANEWDEHPDYKAHLHRLSIVKMARLSRFVTGHAPVGGFRQRFNLEGRINCWCGHQVETRDHILTDCPLWFKIWDPGGPVRRTLSTALIGNFLHRNPMVATFEWSTLR